VEYLSLPPARGKRRKNMIWYDEKEGRMIMKKGRRKEGWGSK
jgi:hypothetical protein